MTAPRETDSTDATSAVIGRMASPGSAERHFAEKLAFETDCWDVHEALASGEPGFVLIDVRSEASYRTGHAPGAVNLPHRRIDGSRLEELSPELPFVVYCNGPHCNGADKAALRIARAGRAVKVMIGGMHGWELEGFAIEPGAQTG